MYVLGVARGRFVRSNQKVVCGIMYRSTYVIYSVMAAVYTYYVKLKIKRLIYRLI